MVIDVRSEKLIPLDDARELFPSNPTVRTLRRWADEGFGGVVLETVKSGRLKCTTAEAAAKFMEATSQ